MCGEGVTKRGTRRTRLGLPKKNKCVKFPGQPTHRLPCCRLILIGLPRIGMFSFSFLVSSTFKKKIVYTLYPFLGIWPALPG